jgi:hypothetical protein
MTSVASRVSRSLFYRLFPRVFWAPYAKKAEQIGLKTICIILSYDCDTDADAQASGILNEWLRSKAIRATFAVPGKQLARNRFRYIDIKKSGSFFINHGGAAHTQWKNNRYWSTTFYDQMTENEVVNDIRRGHEVFIDVLGEEPKGFRAPHFGHFQSEQNLELIYRTLRELGGYQYVSGTLPTVAMKNGPIYKVDGLYEIPVLGSYYWPTRIFDSWTHRKDRMSRQVKESYGSELISTIRAFRHAGIPALLNYYADPSHVVASQRYYEALEYALDSGVVFLDYQDIIQIIETGKAGEN